MTLLPMTSGKNLPCAESGRAPPSEAGRGRNARPAGSRRRELHRHLPADGAVSHAVAIHSRQRGRRNRRGNRAGGDGSCRGDAGAGGVGLLLVQMAKQRGARVIGTVSTPEKARLTREAGADDVILYEEKDFETEVRRLTGGQGVEVVYDSVGQATFEKSMNCLTTRGCLVLYGQSSGPVPPFDPQALNTPGGLFLTRAAPGHYTRNREGLLARANQVLGWVGGGRLRGRLGETFPLPNAGEAHRKLAGRGTTGKILLLS